ncbi:hypothetical protein NMG60_11025483 [Bertholletia excelsa]
MFSGLKFIPRDQVQKVEDEELDESKRERKKSSNKKQKGTRKKKSSHYSSSDDDLDRITKVSRKKKRWYSSDEDSSYSYESGSESVSENDKKKHRNKKKQRKRYDDKSDDEDINRSNKKSRRRRRKDYLSGDNSSSTSEGEHNDSNSGRGDKHEKRSRTHGRKGGSQKEEDMASVQDGATDDYNIVRKEMGLEWMLRPKDIMERKSAIPNEPDEAQVEIKQENPRELNPYLKNNGTGYPETAEDGKMARGNQILSSAVVGDGGASWRLKAMKRAKEQAAREGRSFEEVVEERWGSVGQMTVSLASHRAASSHAHLHAIKNRKKGLTEEQHTVMDDQKEEVIEKKFGRERLAGVSHHHSEMRLPKVHDSLSWGKRKSQNVSFKDSGLITTAMSSLNKFADGGSFMKEYMQQQTNESGGSAGSSHNRDTESALLERGKPSDSGAIENQGLSANQLAAKAMQLRLKGNHEEAEKLLKEAQNIREKHVTMDRSSRLQSEGNTRRHDTPIRQKKNEDDADMHLARTIFQNKQYSMSSHIDDEYDYGDGPKRKSRRKGANDQNSTEKNTSAKRILTQQERCQFCFENPNRPRHLVVAIANFTYVSLPYWQSVVPGHCCILTLQHESATRAVDNNVWDEIRNFKKCLIRMFAKQEKDVVFLETVMALAKQRRHCLVECIPLPCDIAKQAPLYFKKAIDEAEDEWSQHNSKKLIDTSEKGLRGSIPKDFPYFHVEFGLNRGFVHVIDDETQFKSNFGVNVVRGMLKLPEEDMYGRRKHDSLEKQKQAVASFAQDWEPFDWTKQLD